MPENGDSAALLKQWLKLGGVRALAKVPELG